MKIFVVRDMGLGTDAISLVTDSSRSRLVLQTHLNANRDGLDCIVFFLEEHLQTLLDQHIPDSHLMHPFRSENDFGRLVVPSPPSVVLGYLQKAFGVTDSDVVQHY